LNFPSAYSISLNRVPKCHTGLYSR
jgi:hypothetical protein